MAYLDDGIIIGQEGFDTYCLGHRIEPSHLDDGRFCAVVRTDRGFDAFTDCCGQDTIFYHVSQHGWALSNSFLVLARGLHARGLRLHLHRPALLTALAAHSSTQQLVSNQTAITEIRVLPKDHLFRVNGGSVSIEPRPRVREGRPYEQLLLEFVTKWSSRLDSLREHFGDLFTVDMSGGRDTRILLALLVANGRDLSTWSIVSNPAATNDFETAQMLAHRFGFSIAQRNIRVPLAEPRLAYELWKLGNLGVYWPVCWPTAATPVHAASLHGACGECFRAFYRAADGLRFLKGLLNRTEVRGVKDAVSSEFERAFREMKTDARSLDSLNQHYRHFRSRFHFGREWYRSLSSRLVAPMGSPELLAAFELLSPDQRTRAQMHCDLMLLVEPDLATLPFDEPTKAFTTATLESSPFFRSRLAIKGRGQSLPVFAPRATPMENAQLGKRGRTDLVPLLLADMKANSDAARSLQIFPKEYEAQAVERIRHGHRITTDASPAAQIVAAGELARLCEN